MTWPSSPPSNELIKLLASREWTYWRRGNVRHLITGPSPGRRHLEFGAVQCFFDLPGLQDVEGFDNRLRRRVKLFLHRCLLGYIGSRSEGLLAVVQPYAILVDELRQVLR